MPFWIKCIIMFWICTFVGTIFVRIWSYNEIDRIVRRDYPEWVLCVGFSVVISILSVIPILGWLIFH